MKAEQHIFLVGFMGCGKSTVGRLLAHRLARPFIDLDGEIEEAAGRSIARIFAEDGEAAFRRLESRALGQVAGRPPAVVALGGGAFCQSGNRKKVAESGSSLWLQAPVEILLQRVGGDQGRPLAQDEERFRSLYRSRLDDYRKADFHLPTQGLSPAQVADAALRALDI
ncbi:MAG TPA: shikimate kinase [Acidobacteriota bacterium]|nr:shikimate kinase [Acidobacteriota bacterium]